MSNTLIKETNEVIVPGSAGTAGYSYYTLVEHDTWIAVHYPELPTGGPFVAQLIGGREYPVGGSGISVFATAVKKVTYTLELVTVPPVAPTPPTVLTDYNEGWNAGARSERFFVNNGVVTCTVPSSTVGATFGLCHDDPLATLDGQHFAFQMIRGSAYLWLGSTQINLSTPYTSATVFKIIRRNGLIQFLMDDVLKFTDVDPTPSRPMFAAASLYRGADSIDNPTLHGEEDFVNSFRYMNMLGGASLSQAIMSMEPLTMTSGWNVGATMSMESMVVHGADHSEGSGVMTLQPATILAYTTGVAPGTDHAALVLVGLGMSAHGLTGELGEVAVTMKSLAMLGADHPYGQAILSMETPLMFGASEGNGAGTMRSEPAFATSMLSDVLIIALMSEGGAFADVMLATRLVNGSAFTAVTATPVIDTIAAFIDVLMRSTVVVGADVPLVDEDNEAWVLNVDTGATSTYEQYPFNSFARIGDDYYGARADGVYLLEGNDDNGAPIHASAALGRHNFGVLNKKRLKNVLVAAASDDTVYLKVIVEQGAADEVEYVYAARNFSRGMAVQRVDVGQGIRANYLTFELFNKNGADFEFEQLQFEIIDIARSTG